MVFANRLVRTQNLNLSKRSRMQFHMSGFHNGYSHDFTTLVSGTTACFASSVPDERLYDCTYNVHTQADIMGTTRVNFRLPDDLVEKADVAAEVTHKNRTEIIIDALQEFLDEIEDDDRFREDVIDLYLDGTIGFEVLAEFIGRQDAEAVRASKTILDQGDDLADDLADL